VGSQKNRKNCHGIHRQQNSYFLKIFSFQKKNKMEMKKEKLRKNMWARKKKEKKITI
jgi:hypothetical protein